MKGFRWITAFLVLIFGVAAVGNWTSPKWVVLTLCVHAVPVLAQLLRNNLVQVYGLWFGAFIVMQNLITPLILDRDYKTLPPGMLETIDVVGDTLVGISGIQKITTDDQGYRVTRPIDYRNKPDNTYRIFAIGGSTTEQIVLDDRRTWAHLLQEELSATAGFGAVEVINTGISGARAINHLATLRQVLDYSPDLVLILVGINDWNRHIWNEFGAPEVRNPGVPRSDIQFSISLVGLVMNGLLGGRDEPDPDAVKIEDGEYYYLQNDSLSRDDVRSFAPDSVSEDYASVLREIASTCLEAGIDCMFATQPHAYEPDIEDGLRKRLWMTPPNTEYTLDLPSLEHVANTYNSHLLQLASETGLGKCDLAANFEASTETLFDDCHYNVEGARRVAAMLSACVTAESR